MSDHIARAEAARQRAIDDGRDMWGLTDWKLEAYAQEDRKNAEAEDIREAVAWLAGPLVEQLNEAGEIADAIIVADLANRLTPASP